MTGHLFQTGYTVWVGRGTDPAAKGEKMAGYTAWDHFVDGLSAFVLCFGFYTMYCVAAGIDLILVGM